jgi:hypothetical protein
VSLPFRWALEFLELTPGYGPADFAHVPTWWIFKIQPSLALGNCMDNYNFFMNRIILHVKNNQRYIINCYSISMHLLDIFAHGTKICSI